jgi:NitT/TauT family transport system ATP-binding protein
MILVAERPGPATARLETPKRMDAVVELTGVDKVYPTKDGSAARALRTLDLRIDAGEFVSLLGPSGCGKTTLLRMIAGLEAPSSGRIAFAGSDRLGDFGFVFQRDVLLDWRTVLDNVLLPVEFRRGQRAAFRDRAHELLTLFGLSGYAGRHPWELSGGMRQRVAICRALILDPPILLMDEPFGALDAMTRDALNLEVQSLWQRSGKTIIFVTHGISEAVFLSSRVVVMSGRPGTIVEDMPIDLRRPRTLDVRDEPVFGDVAKHLRHVLDRHGAAA